MLHSILQSTPNIDPLVQHLQHELTLVIAREKEANFKREELDAKILISEQIIANLRQKEDEAIAAAEEYEQTMKEKLDKKEYALQLYEIKIVQYEKYMKRMAVNDQVARDLLFRYQADTVFDDSEDEEEGEGDEEEKRVSNVVDENMRLKAENKEAQGIIKEMQKKIEILNQK